MNNYDSKAKNLITGPNLLLNPSFETVLFGTHNTIKTHSSNNWKNTQLPGWQGYTPSGKAMTVDAEGTIVNSPGKQSCKVSGVTASAYLEQHWNGTHYLDTQAAQCRGLYSNFSMDIKLVNPVGSACRIGISVDGGSSYTYSGYKANDTNWERLFVSASTGTTATDVRFRVELASATPTYYLDNGMVVTSASSLITLPFIPRFPVSVYYELDTVSQVMLGNAWAGTINADCNNSGSWAVAWTPNNVRPPWATRVLLTNYSRSPAIGTSRGLYFRPTGGVSWRYQEMGAAYAVNAELPFSLSDVQLGADSLYNISITTGTYWESYLLGWKGIDL